MEKHHRRTVLLGHKRALLDDWDGGGGGLHGARGRGRGGILHQENGLYGRVLVYSGLGGGIGGVAGVQTQVFVKIGA